MTIPQAFDIALQHHQAGRLAEAEALYRQILAQQPQHADALHGLGLIACATGQHAGAFRLISSAISHAPNHAAYHSNLAVACSHLGRTEDAVACYRRAIALQPDLAEAHTGLGAALSALGRLDEAIAMSTRAVTLRPDSAEAHNNLGKALGEKGRRTEALACFGRALELDPDNAEANNNLGGLLVAEGRWDDAIACLQRALAVQPGHADAYSNLGGAFVGKGEFERALACCRKAVACRPDSAGAHFFLAGVLLLLGHHEEGWREYEWRWQYSGFGGVRRNFPAPKWDGSRITGRTILLHAEQGFGDILQFLRYLPLVRGRADAASVIFECPPELTRLLTHDAGWDVQIVPMRGTDGKPLPHFDFHLPLLSLPWALGQSEPQNPALPPGPYLHAEPSLRTLWRNRLHSAAGLRVGLAWAGRPTHLHDRRRSIPLETFLPLLRVAGVSFHSLQLAPDPAQLQTLAGAGVSDLTAHISDFADTAALVAELDLVITVDTAVAHLAGALGRPVWTLLPTVPDWRWGLEKGDTPWYPTMRLFRQEKDGDWDSVIRRVAQELLVLRS